MSPPRVSVLMPCYNATDFVAEAIESILNQNWENLEIIVVDDGSTDGSAAVVQKYTSLGVKLIRQENLGQCAAANRALNAAGGELIKFFDADDVMHPELIARQVAALSGRSDVVALGEWSRFYGDDLDTARFERLPMYRNAEPVDWLVDAWMDAQPMMQCGLWLIPRQIFAQSGPWDETLSLINDFEFFTRVLLSARSIAYSPGARMYYRSGINGSLSGRKSRKAIESAFQSILLGTQHLLNAEDSPRTRRASANIFQSFEYENYPHHADLRANARRRVAELGGSDLAPIGPPRFHALRRLVGWRAARRVKLAVGR